MIHFYKRINELVSTFPETSFGSYPSLVNQYFKTRISYDSPSPEQLVLAREYIKSNMPVVDYDKVPEENSLEKIQTLISGSSDPVFKDNLNQSLAIIKECFDRYSPEEVSVCYNGGKDCIVMLHLVHAYFKATYPTGRLKSLYIRELNTFSEVDSFITESIIKYKLDNKTISLPMKAALKQLLEEDTSIKASVLGIRDGDPGSQYQDSFSPTDGDWPRIMRVNPILRWRYQDVWTFLRGLNVPYPSLYDQGYTSLGNPDNTEPNPALRFTDEKGVARYRPAYLLEDGTLERQGRIKKS